MRYWLSLAWFICSAGYAQLNIQSWQTPEGAKVLFVQTQGLPMLDIALNFDAASSRDGDQHGLGSLTNALIGTATTHQSEEQIIQTFESLGAEFSTHSLKDMSIISLRSLTRPQILNRAVSLFSEVVAKPKFTQAKLTRERKQMLRALAAAKQSPGDVASLAFAQSVFAPHPYAHNKLGDEHSLGAITPADVKAHYRRYYSAKNLTIALVGGISAVKAKQIARQLSHGLNIGEKAPEHPMVQPLTQASTQHIEFPSTQTHLLIGQVGINRLHPDYYALYLGNHLLGGSGLNSILSREIREDKGLAYSTSSYFTKMKAHGYFLIKLQTKNTQADQAKSIALNTLSDFIKRPISAESLQDAKDNIIGGFALEIASNANILTYLSIIGFYGLPLDYLSSFTQHIKTLDETQVQQAFNRLIDTNKLAIISVGQRQ